MNNLFDNQIINFNNSQNDLINIQNEQESQKVLLIYFFRLFLLYKILPIILLNLSKLLYFFSLYLVNYSDENSF